MGNIMLLALASVLMLQAALLIMFFIGEANIAICSTQLINVLVTGALVIAALLIFTPYNVYDVPEDHTCIESEVGTFVCFNPETTACGDVGDGNLACSVK